jgi:putative ABC transport system ATP-binding protein
MTALVQVRDLARGYSMGTRAVPALRGVSFDVRQGEWVAIVGPSGCGKSTLLNLLGAVDKADAGSLTIDGQRLDQLSDSAATSFRLRRIGFVFQRFYLMPALSAAENIELPMAEARMPRELRRARVKELLGYVGLQARAEHRPSELSGGEQQRIAVARALANKPALLLADEPTGELDAATGLEMIALFRQLHRDGTTIVVVTHDAQMAAAAGRRIHMRDGVIVDADIAEAHS